MDLVQDPTALFDLIRKAVRLELEAARDANDRLMTAAQLAKHYHRAPQYIRDLCSAGLLPAIQQVAPGGKMAWHIRASDAAKVIPLSPRLPTTSHHRKNA